MILLSVDTSSPLGSLSIVQVTKNNFVTLSHQEWLSTKLPKESHSEVITIQLQRALKKAQVNLSQVNLIICGVGPGSFTGIRVSVNFAKSLAFSLNISLIAISSLTSLAHQSKEQRIAKNVQDPKQEAFLSLIHAFSKKIYLASYSYPDFHSVLKKQVVNYNELETLLKTKDINLWHISGDAYLLFEKYFSNSIKKNFHIYSKILYPNSLNMVKLFLSNQTSHNKLNWRSLLPLYIRKSSAEELADLKQNTK